MTSALARGGPVPVRSSRLGGLLDRSPGNSVVAYLYHTIEAWGIGGDDMGLMKSTKAPQTLHRAAGGNVAAPRDAGGPRVCTLLGRARLGMTLEPRLGSTALDRADVFLEYIIGTQSRSRLAQAVASRRARREAVVMGQHYTLVARVPLVRVLQPGVSRIILESIGDD